MPDQTFNLALKANVLNVLTQMGPKLEKKFLNKALQQGAKIVKAAAVAGAMKFTDPKDPMHVYQQIQVYTSASLGKANGGVALQVGVKGGAMIYRNNKSNRQKGRVGKSYMGPGNVYYWRFLEFGTSKMKAQPFMRPALANNIEPVTDAIVSGINDGIDAIVGGA